MRGRTRGCEGFPFGSNAMLFVLDVAPGNFYNNLTLVAALGRCSSLKRRSSTAVAMVHWQVQEVVAQGDRDRHLAGALMRCRLHLSPS